MIRLWDSLLTAFLLFPSLTSSTDLPQLDTKVTAQLKAYISSHYMTPEDYVISKFRDHDVVFLGEHRRYKHNVELARLKPCPDTKLGNGAPFCNL